MNIGPERRGYSDSAILSQIGWGRNVPAQKIQIVGTRNKEQKQADALGLTATRSGITPQDLRKIYDQTLKDFKLIHGNASSPYSPSSSSSTITLGHVSKTGSDPVVRINTLNAGDSRVSLIITTYGSDKVQVHPLTTDHTVDNEQERTRILEAGATITKRPGTEYEYLTQSREILNNVKKRHTRITRAVGDTWFDHVSDTPDAHQVTIARKPKKTLWHLFNKLLLNKPPEADFVLEHNQYAFIVAETDGLHLNLSPENRQEILERWAKETDRPLTAKNIVEAFATHALAVKCPDDISGVAAEIPLRRDGRFDFLTAASDGTGQNGAEVAREFTRELVKHAAMFQPSQD